MVKFPRRVCRMEKIFLVVDTETTGSNPFDGDRILEIAAIPVYKDKIRYDLSYHSLVDPQVRIPGFITTIHGLKNSDVKNKPILREIFPDFKRYVGNSIIVGHGIKTDMIFFDFASRESGINPLSNNFIDTLEITKEIFPDSSHKLSDIAVKLKINDKPTHRAYDDARVTAKVFLHLIHRVISMPALMSYSKKWKG